MTSRKAAFAFCVVLAGAMNLAFFVGEIGDPGHHDVWALLAALAVALIATALNLADRSPLNAVQLSAILVVDYHLFLAAVIWGSAAYTSTRGVDTEAMASLVSLSGGALLANVLSVIILVAASLIQRR